jgi:hypothetical protein
MTRQPAVPKGWRFPIKPNEASSYFPDAEDIVWLGPSTSARRDYQPETVYISLHGRSGEGVRVVIRAVPLDELPAARKWIEETVQPETTQWLTEYRAASQAKQQHATLRWYWPSRTRRGASWQ